MEHLQNAKLHENINSVTFGDSLESVNKPKPTKEVCPYMPIRLVRTDTYGHSSQASAVRTTFCGSPVSGKWLAVPITIPLSTKRKIKREQLESVNKPKPHKRSVSVYAYPTCSDRHIRTFFSGFGGADNLLWLTREWQVVGCTYPCSAFNKKQKAQVVKAVVT